MTRPYTDSEVAHVCHEAIRALQHVLGDPLPSQSWPDAPQADRDGTTAAVAAARLGATPEHLHDSWCTSKQADGWVHGAAKDPVKREHPCLIPYEDLPSEQRDKDSLITAIVAVLLDTP